MKTSGFLERYGIEGRDFYNLVQYLKEFGFIKNPRMRAGNRYSEEESMLVSRAIEYRQKGIGRKEAAEKAVIDIYGESSQKHQEYLQAYENRKKKLSYHQRKKGASQRKEKALEFMKKRPKPAEIRKSRYFPVIFELAYENPAVHQAVELEMLEILPSRIVRNHEARIILDLCNPYLELDFLLRHYASTAPKNGSLKECMEKAEEYMLDFLKLGEEERGLLERRIRKLPERERHLLESYYNECPKTLAEIEHDMDVTRSRAWQIKDYALRKLRKQPEAKYIRKNRMLKLSHSSL